MAHSHDRTYLASLGFADPDKKSSEHDLACQYLGQIEVRRSLAFWIEKQRHCVPKSIKVKKYAEYEVPIHKGENQYKTTIGFLDMIFDYKFEIEDNSIRFGGVVIEVKINRVTTSDIIRQVNLYKEYIKPKSSDRIYRIVVITKFDITAEDLLMLKSAGILWIKLGKSFIEFVEEQQIENASMADGEEI